MVEICFRYVKSKKVISRRSKKYQKKIFPIRTFPLPFRFIYLNDISRVLLSTMTSRSRTGDRDAPAVKFHGISPQQLLRHADNSARRVTTPQSVAFIIEQTLGLINRAFIAPLHSLIRHFTIRVPFTEALLQNLTLSTSISHKLLTDPRY